MIAIRRVFIQLEDIFHEFGPPPATPLRRGAAVAVIENPFAGRFEPLIASFMQDLQPVGLELAQRLVAALGAGREGVLGYGKSAIVGAAGEVEHGALWHAPGGYAMRETLGWKDEGDAAAAAAAGGVRPGNALAIVPSTKKVGAPGTAIDVPLTHVNASYVRDHLDAIEVRVPGAPAANEIVFILAMSTGPRIHARLGGLKAEQIERWDGQR